MKVWIALFTIVFALRVAAHEVRPAYLELIERAPSEFDVLWKVPALGGASLAGEDLSHELSTKENQATDTLPCGCPAPTTAQILRGVLPIHPSMPQQSEMVIPPFSERLQGAEIQRWTFRSPQGLDGWEVTVHGLSGTMVDVLVRIATRDGRVVSRLLRPDAPSFTYHATDAGHAASGYFRLGVEHIVFGIDHLLFVLCLLLLVNGVAPVVRTITAFTIAHSITLALATLGYVHIPPAPVEATIALSIVFLATGILKRRAELPSLTERKPWLIAFTFGLLHGFGFAGALSQVGLPPHDIPVALLLFNLGVEAGQLAFVALVVTTISLLRCPNLHLPCWAPIALPYAIGAVAMFWVIERTAAIW